MTLEAEVETALAVVTRSPMMTGMTRRRNDKRQRS